MAGVKSGLHLRVWGFLSIFCRVAFAVTLWGLVEKELVNHTSSTLIKHTQNIHAVMWTLTALTAAQVCFYPCARGFVHTGWDTNKWQAPIQDLMNVWSVLLWCFMITLFVQAEWYFSTAWRPLMTVFLSILTLYIVNNCVFAWAMFCMDFTIPEREGHERGAKYRQAEEGKAPGGVGLGPGQTGTATHA